MDEPKDTLCLYRRAWTVVGHGRVPRTDPKTIAPRCLTANRTMYSWVSPHLLDARMKEFASNAQPAVPSALKQSKRLTGHNATTNSNVRSSAGLRSLGWRCVWVRCTIEVRSRWEILRCRFDQCAESRCGCCRQRLTSCWRWTIQPDSSPNSLTHWTVMPEQSWGWR